MSTATVARATGEAAFRSAAELREVLGRLLAIVDADDRVGPMLRAAHVRTRFEFPDRRLGLNLASADGEAHCVEWSFGGPADWEPKVTLRMDSEVANSWLQGHESLAIAIARGRVRCRGETKSTLIFVPVARLLCDPYKRLIDEEYRHLEIDK